MCNDMHIGLGKRKVNQNCESDQQPDFHPSANKGPLKVTGNATLTKLSTVLLSRRRSAKGHFG
jgi:hypothetical protein